MKILVPTDFSANSKAGVRFAIHWATQQKMELVFIHVLYVLRGTRWSKAYFEKYAAQEEASCKTIFEKFISAIYRNMNVKPGSHSIMIVQGISPDIAMQDYCLKNPSIDYICISTRGAGKFKKIFGTNTGNLITKSQVPVMAIPKTNRTSAIKKILYATDFRNYSEELKRVVDFALPFKATVEVLHFTWPHEIIFDEQIIERVFKKKYKYGLKIRFEKNDAVKSLIENLQTQIRITKPSVVIMFTNQQRTLFNKIFLSSKAEELSFETKVPLLVFNKT